MLCLAALVVGLQALVLCHLVGIHRFLCRLFGYGLCLDGPLTLLLGTDGHLLRNLRLAYCLLAAFLGESLLSEGYLLHLLAHTAVNHRLFLLFAQKSKFRLQFADAHSVAMTHIKSCCYQ